MRGDKPSRTAAKVALNVLLLGAKPEVSGVLPAGSVPATERLLAASGAVSPTAIRWASSRLMLRLSQAFDFLMPGQLEAFAHRKAFCERQVSDAIGQGAEQVLVLGAGYDTLAWRLAAELPAVRWFEIDHPATALLKARGIAAMGQSANHHLLAEDLSRKGLRDVLRDSGRWDESARSVIVAEGLTQYLAPQEVEQLFRQCSASCGAGSRLAFTYIPTARNGRPDAGPWSALVLWLLARGGEPWRSSLRPADLDSLLQRTGWQHSSELMGLQGRHGLECFAVAERRRAAAAGPDRETAEVVS